MSELESSLAVVYANRLCCFAGLDTPPNSTRCFLGSGRSALALMPESSPVVRFVSLRAALAVGGIVWIAWWTCTNATRGMCFRHVWSLHEREAPAHGLEGPRHFYPQLELASSLKASDGDAGMWESLKVSDGDAGRVGDAPPPPPCT